ncbi:hypothetical protein IAU60_003181 [Kwoniella sp. DSM 27419]
MTDFSSREYWETRFRQERGFEWLAGGYGVVGKVLEHLPDDPVVLHFGAGTSSLGRDLASAGVVVHDADYVQVPGALLLDVLSLDAMIQAPKVNTFLDKSTADAIACGQVLPGFTHPVYGASPVDPLQRLAWNLARVSTAHARWISISYSATRFDSVREWTQLHREMIATTYIPGGRRVRDGDTERIVHEPETGVWLHVLERG